MSDPLPAGYYRLDDSLAIVSKIDPVKHPWWREWAKRVRDDYIAAQEEERKA